MRFPYTIVIEPSTQPGRHGAGGRWWAWLLVVSLLAGALIVVVTFLFFRPWRASRPAAASAGGFLQITGAPAGASIELDGRQAGQAPARIAVRPGQHHVRIAAKGHLSAGSQVDVGAGATATVNGALWLAQPRLRELLPPLPGASVAGASFLRDGRVALEVAIPPGDERQLWIDGPGTQQRRVGPVLARGSVAASPDGRRVAYLMAPAHPGTAGQAPTELWLAGIDGQHAVRRYALPPQRGGASQLVDVSWAPDGQHLLLVSKREATAGGQRTTVQWLAADQGEPRALISLPSEVLSGSEGWSPDGRWVAFLTATSSGTPLCLLGVMNGDFRYLGDLSTGGPSHPLPLTPVSWAPDSRQLLYAASKASPLDATAWLLGGGGTTAVYAVNPMSPVPRLIPTAHGQSPTWLPDDSLLALARGKGNGPIALRQFSGAGLLTEGRPLALTSGPVYGAAWDLPHARALIAVRGDGLSLSGEADQYWLARFRPKSAQ